MRLDAVTIGEYKNLRDVHVDFDETSPYTVLVGENGAGKSNLIEALAHIFRNLDLDIEAPFDYGLRYRCRGRDVEIRAERDAMPRFWVRTAGEDEYEELPRRRFVDDLDDRGRPLYRPAFVFGYYSGPSDRLAVLFEKHQERYYSWMIKPRPVRETQAHSSGARRRLFYAQTVHGQFALLAFFMRPRSGEEDDREFLREHLQIDGLDSVLFALRRPPWRQIGGDPRFWHAEGEVREFLDRLHAAALLPMRMPRRMTVDLTKNPEVENLYLFLPTPQHLEEVYASYPNQYAFFTALESTYISKVLGEVRTRVRMTAAAGGGEVTYRDLSEGEQQLLMVLGLLKFTAEDETLFLLDEPDTHLNPAWSTQYLDFLNHFIAHRESCHIVMSTHDPLVFSRLSRAEVRILRRDAHGVVQAEAPTSDPRGMGVQAILTSDLFRLRSTLDPDTQRDLDLQRRLAAKEGDLTREEEDELRSVNARLHERGFWTTDRDPVYTLFLRKWAQRERPEWAGTVELTPEQMREQDALAEEIVAELLSESTAPEARRP